MMISVGAWTLAPSGRILPLHVKAMADARGGGRGRRSTRSRSSVWRTIVTEGGRDEEVGKVGREREGEAESSGKERGGEERGRIRESSC